MGPVSDMSAEQPMESDSSIGKSALRRRLVSDDAGTSKRQRPSEVGEEPKLQSKAVWSSGVAFYPPSRNFWRIGGKWYDFTNFLDKHPGGADVLKLCRDRYEDCTFVFESHHHNYRRARAAIKKYEVSSKDVLSDGVMARPSHTEKLAAHHDAFLDAGGVPRLSDENSFHSVIRDRVTAYLRSVGHPDGGPTKACVTLFWSIFIAWICSWAALLHTGSFFVCPLLGFVSAQLGAFGHNWVHQPKYKLWAYLSLDTIGFSSDGWWREHNLQHHMYTNTPWDNHFKGTDPFLVTDPTVERSFLQRYLMPYVNPIVLSFGMWGNYAFHLSELLRGNEVLRPSKLFLPLQIAVVVVSWGWLRGVGLLFASYAVMSVYYFTMALMNHNAEHTHNVHARNAARDWGEAQLQSSADWGVHLTFSSAWKYLWLNYHTVHHLFPRIDFSHHPAVQSMLIETTKEFGIEYHAGRAIDIYREMINSFATPHSLMQEIIVYSGGL
jgi:fatty acid desaturase/cytochrome b involved in lipid metabolism